MVKDRPKGPTLLPSLGKSASSSRYSTKTKSQRRAKPTRRCDRTLPRGHYIYLSLIFIFTSATLIDMGYACPVP